MLQTQIPPTIEQVKHLACQLSPQDLLTLISDEMMSIAESGFQEWNDPEENIYDAAS